MSLIQSAKLNGQDPYAYPKDVFTRLPTQPASRIDALLPHRYDMPWTAGSLSGSFTKQTAGFTLTTNGNSITVTKQ